MQREQQRSTFIPMLIIGIGVYWLLTSLNVLPNQRPFAIIMQFLPVLLVGLGIDLIFVRKRRWLSSLLAITLTLGLIGYGAWSTDTQPIAGTQDFNQPKIGVRSASITLDSNASNVQIMPLTSPSTDLLRGSLVNSNSTLNFKHDLEDQTAEITLNAQSSGWLMGPSTIGDWQIELANDVPLSLKLEVNAGDLEANLAPLNIMTFELDVNAGSARIDAPHAGTLKLDINATDLTINLPEGVGVQLKTDSNVSDINLPSAWTTSNSDTYTSANWNTASQKLIIELDASASSVQINQ